MDENNLIIFKYFGMIGGVTGLIMCTKELEPLVIFPGNDSDLRSTFAHNFAAIFELALETLDPDNLPRLVIFCAMLLSEDNIRQILAVARNLHQAVLPLFHERVNFMEDLRGLK